MNIKIKNLQEIIDSNGELIGNDAIPTNGSDLDSQANNTTDYNAIIGQQPFTYSTMALFGMYPFREGVEDVDDSSAKDLLSDLTGLMHQKYAEVLEYYYRNPNKLKSDFRKSKEETPGHDPKCEERDIKWANEIIKIIQPHLEKSVKKSEKIDESVIIEDAVVEDRLVDKKSEDEMSKKSENDDIKNKEIEKVAGLINKKLDKKDIDKLINLLERK